MRMELDPLRPDRVARHLPDRLRAFNDAGVLSSADVHTAMRLAALTGCADDDAVLAAAFAVRAPRYGHVFAQLDQLADTVTDEDGRIVELDAMAWPTDIGAWVAVVANSPLVVADPDGVAPLHLDGARLYLDRYWRYEHRVAASLRARTEHVGTPAVVVAERGWKALAHLFDGNPEQLDAATAALSRRLSVIAGGPGTGKTATIASAVAVALNHAARPDGRPLRVSIAAPTGKAAARLGEALRQSAASMPTDLLDPAVLKAVGPTTIHRLLGWTPNTTRFRRDADDPLPCDLVIVDEVSMVALGMLSRLLDAVPVDANLVLVGDPDQLAAVEAGTVLGDLVSAGSPSGEGSPVTGEPSDRGVPVADEPSGAAGWALAGRVVTLRRGYRFDDDIKAFAMAVRDGRAAEALDCLTVDPQSLEDCKLSLVVPDRPGEWPTGTGALAGVRRLVTHAARVMVEHGRRGDATAALEATLATKVLCAHRRGPDGVQVWNAAIEGWVHDVPAYRRPRWYPGRPVIVTDNDYNLSVFNGDIGVVVRDGDHLRVVIDGRSGRPIEHRRLPGVQTVHAMTVHKSQGSQFQRVIVILPSERSPVLTRQLLYTAVTRARTAVTIVGSPEALADAIARPVSRASALPERLRSR